MSSPKRDKYSPGSGKMYDENDDVFDFTAWAKSVGVSILTAMKLKNKAGVEINPATKEDQDDIEDNQTDGSQKTQIVTNGDVVDPQNPLSCDGDSVYVKDIWEAQSSIGDFSGAITDLFNNLHSVITNTTSDDPKEILIHFNRTIPILVIGLGAFTGNFSNVKIIGVTSGHVEFTIFDESSDNTDKTSLTAFTPTAGFNAIKIQFHTTDTVSLSNVFILKATSTVARIQGQKPDGEFTEFQATAGGNFKISLEEYESETFLVDPLPVADFYLNVAKGLVPGHSIMSKFGQNDDIGTGAYEDIWDKGGTYTYPADGTAPIVKLVGHNSADTEPIEVQGLDINGDLVVQTKTITGLTPVTLDTPLWRVFRLKNVGTSDLVADVCAIDTGDTVDYACINNGNNQTLMALYTIPNGKTGYLVQGTNSIIGATRDYNIQGKLWMKPYGLVFQLKKTFGLDTGGSGYMVMPFPLPNGIPAKTDIRVSAISSKLVGGLNTTFEILLVDD